MVATRSSIGKKGHKRLLGVRVSALVEILMFIGVVILFDYFFGKGDRYFDVSPHPFSIIVLLVTVQYGTMEGIVAALFSTIALYAWNVPPQKVGQTLFDYQFSLALMPLIWFISSFVLGEVRMRHTHEKRSLLKKLEQSHKQLDAISEEYEALKKTKENMESHLVSQHHRVTTTFKALKGLETLKPAQVLMKLSHVIEGAIHVKKFSVYAIGEHGLEVVTSEGWEPEDSYSLRIVQEHPLFWQIYGEQRLVCVVNESDEKTLRGEGLIAAPLVDPATNEVFGMVKVEDIDFSNLNVSSIETFKILCELIGMSYANARQYQETKRNLIYHNVQREVYSDVMYKGQKKYLNTFCENINVSLSELLISLSRKLTQEEESHIIDTLSLMIKMRMPPLAQLFYMGGKGNLLAILLPKVSLSEAEKLSHTLLETIVKSEKFGDMTFKFNSQKLFEAKQQENYAKK